MLSILKKGLFFLFYYRKGPALGIICFLITIGILIAGLWPFNFIPTNKVKWLQDGNGIRFYGQGIVFSEEPIVIQETAAINPSVTIELLVRPYRENRTMMSSILTLYDHGREQILIGQWNKELFIRVPRDPAGNVNNPPHYREIGVENALEENTTHLISITSEKRHTDIYIDGKLAKGFTHFSLIPDKRGLSGHLILGNSPNGMHTWNGTFLGLAIYNRSVTDKEVLDHYDVWQQGGKSLLSEKKRPLALYVFDENGGERIRNHSYDKNHLRLPKPFQPFRRTVLSMPTGGQWFARWNLMDVAVNILGFVPFGYFLSAWLRQTKNLPAPRVYGISMLLGFCLSLAIELTQVYLPTRDSSLLDVISNTLGTAAGVLLFKYTLPVLHKIKGSRTDLT